ncbi:MAG: PilX N-terminal domain-containing pilus assembly protein [Gammaproteobacteria bacterium]
MKKSSVTPASQRGAVLFISLIMLLVMTLLGVSGLKGTTIEEKMAGNLLDSIHALQAAEAALREGESQLTAVTVPNVSTTPWLSEANETSEGSPIYTTTGNLTSSSSSADLTTTMSTLPNQPSYLVEILPPVTNRAQGPIGFNEQNTTSSFYRITAYSEGKTDKAIAIVQSIYQR